MSRVDVTPPTAIEAENALLGAILINPAAYWDVRGFLTTDDLYLVKNQWVYQAIEAIHARRGPVDFLTVCGELERQGRLDEVGGAVAISQLMDGVPSAIHAEAYGRDVEQTAVRRRLIMAAGEVAKLAYDESRPIEQVIERSERQLLLVAEKRSTGNLREIGTMVGECYDQILERAESGQGNIGPTVGYDDLDNLLGGLGHGNVNYIAGRPGLGKTAMLLEVAMHVAELPDMDGPVAFFSLEMSNEQLIARMIHNRANVSERHFRSGRATEKERVDVANAAGWLGEQEIHLDDTPGLTPAQLRSRCRRLYAEMGLRLIVIDYLQLMQSDRQYNNEVQEVSFISKQLKALARELGTPVLAASQLSRSCEQRADKQPRLSDLRGSGSIEQDADTVVFIYRDDYYKKERSERPSIAEVELAKNRHGPTGKVELFWRGDVGRFLPLEKRSFIQ